LPPGSRLTVRRKGTRFTVSGPGLKKTTLSARVEDLERDHEVVPLTPHTEAVHKITRQLTWPWDRHPLVIGSYQQGPFRSSVAIWVEAGGGSPVRTLGELRERLDKWSGDPPDPAAWLSVQKAADAEARRLVKEMEALADRRYAGGLAAQRAAARERLLRELARYLACWGQGVDDLNGLFYTAMKKGGPAALRLLQAYELLGGYPEWPDELRTEIQAWLTSITENHRQARLLGKELDAALQDPRWKARV
ncbi:MAG: hypothetical protein AB1609_19495, partial [Bacillota bacterium]